MTPNESVEYKLVGVAQAMPGAPGFTMAVFQSIDVPVGVDVYVRNLASDVCTAGVVCSCSLCVGDLK